MNQWIGIGNICNNLELRYTKNNKEVCEFSIAINQQERTDFITCVIFGKQASNLCTYQKKGSKVAVNGSIRVDTYEVEGQRRYKTYVLVNNIEYLSSKSSETVNKEEPTEAQILNSVVNNEDPYVQMGIKTETDELGFDLPF